MGSRPADVTPSGVIRQRLAVREAPALYRHEHLSRRATAPPSRGKRAPACDRIRHPAGHRAGDRVGDKAHTPGARARVPSDDRIGLNESVGSRSFRQPGGFRSMAPESTTTLPHSLNAGEGPAQVPTRRARRRRVGDRAAHRGPISRTLARDDTRGRSGRSGRPGRRSPARTTNSGVLPPPPAVKRQSSHRAPPPAMGY